MRIGIEAKGWNGKYHFAEEAGIQLGRNGGFHDVEGIEERRAGLGEAMLS